MSQNDEKKNSGGKGLILFDENGTILVNMTPTNNYSTFLGNTRRSSTPIYPLSLGNGITLENMVPN